MGSVDTLNSCNQKGKFLHELSNLEVSEEFGLWGNSILLLQLSRRYEDITSRSVANTPNLALCCSLNAVPSAPGETKSLPLSEAWGSISTLDFHHHLTERPETLAKVYELLNNTACNLVRPGLLPLCPPRNCLIWGTVLSSLVMTGGRKPSLVIYLIRNLDKFLNGWSCLAETKHFGVLDCPGLLGEVMQIPFSFH